MNRCPNCNAKYVSDNWGIVEWKCGTWANLLTGLVEQSKECERRVAALAVSPPPREYRNG